MLPLEFVNVVVIVRVWEVVGGLVRNENKESSQEIGPPRKS